MSKPCRRPKNLERFKVLVIPMALHLDQAQTEGIRAFVKNGGLLISDAFAGVFGEEYRADKPGMIADVLGVEFPGGVPGSRVVMESAAGVNELDLGRLAADGGITVKGAIPQGKTQSGIPILLENPFGQGKAIYLNLLIRDYQIRRTLSTELPILETMGRLLADHGLRPVVRIEVRIRRNRYIRSWQRRSIGTVWMGPNIRVPEACQAACRRDGLHVGPAGQAHPSVFGSRSSCV